MAENLPRSHSVPPPVPDWFKVENYEPFTKKKPEPMTEDGINALRIYNLYKSGVSGASAQLRELESKAPALVAVAEAMYLEQEEWRVSQRYWDAKDGHRVEMLWRRKWAGDLVTAMVRS